MTVLAALSYPLHGFNSFGAAPFSAAEMSAHRALITRFFRIRMAASSDYTYDVALSFAGEQRPYVAQVAESLVAAGVRVFYDEYEAATLWGKDLYVRLRDVYERQAKYTIIFASEQYARKVWTNHERESSQARAIRERAEYILPARFDDTEIPGLPHTIGYVDLRQATPQQLVGLILEKLGRRPGTWEVDPTTALPGEGTIPTESLRDRAARLSEQHRVRQSREELLNSEGGVRLAAEQAKELFEYIQREVAALKEQDPELSVSCMVGSDGVLLVRSRRASFTMFWRTQYSNSLEGSSLFTREFDGPHELGYVDRTRARKETHIIFDVDESLRPRWRDSGRAPVTLSSTQLADRYLSRVIERAYGAEG